MDQILEGFENITEFEVELYCEDYPDVIFEIILDSEPTQQQIAAAVKAIDDFVCRYNKKHFLKPIHYVSDVDCLPESEYPNAVAVHVDFGNSSPMALIGVVEALQNTSLPIEKVVLA